MNITENLNNVKKEILNACKISKRKVDSVRLLAVSKKKSLELIEQAIACGHKDFG